jgi:hypothetical protein
VTSATGLAAVSDVPAVVSTPTVSKIPSPDIHAVAGFLLWLASRLLQTSMLLLASCCGWLPDYCRHPCYCWLTAVTGLPLLLTSMLLLAYWAVTGLPQLLTSMLLWLDSATADVHAFAGLLLWLAFRLLLTSMLLADILSVEGSLRLL